MSVSLLSLHYVLSILPSCAALCLCSLHWKSNIMPCCEIIIYFILSFVRRLRVCAVIINLSPYKRAHTNYIIARTLLFYYCYSLAAQKAVCARIPPAHPPPTRRRAFKRRLLSLLFCCAVQMKRLTPFRFGARSGPSARAYVENFWLLCSLSAGFLVARNLRGRAYVMGSARSLRI